MRNSEGRLFGATEPRTEEGRRMLGLMDRLSTAGRKDLMRAIAPEAIKEYAEEAVRKWMIETDMMTWMSLEDESDWYATMAAYKAGGIIMNMDDMINPLAAANIRWTDPVKSREDLESYIMRFALLRETDRALILLDERGQILLGAGVEREDIDSFMEKVIPKLGGHIRGVMLIGREDEITEDDEVSTIPTGSRFIGAFSWDGMDLRRAS